MYMANAKILRLVPNATYIPLTCVGVSRWGNANFRFGVGCFHVSRYQHVGIPNAKFSHWGCYPTPDPNAKGFASQWNIGLSVSFFAGETSLFMNPIYSNTILFIYIQSIIRSSSASVSIYSSDVH